MAVIGELATLVTANTRPFTRAMGKAKVSVGGLVKSIGTLRSSALFLSAGAGIGFSVKLAADAEVAKVAFEVMLGSAEDAQRLIKDLRTFAASTPLSFGDLQAASQTLLQFGINGDRILPTLKQLGDISLGDAQRLRSLSLAFGQASATGRLMGQDLNQMINAGFNPLLEVSKRTGESMGDLKKRMEAGQVSIAEVRQAMEDATGPGGRFFGLLNRQSETAIGQFSTLKDNVRDLARTFGEVLLPAINKLLAALNKLRPLFEDLALGFTLLTEGRQAFNEQQAKFARMELERLRQQAVGVPADVLARSLRPGHIVDRLLGLLETPAGGTAATTRPGTTRARGGDGADSFGSGFFATAGALRQGSVQAFQASQRSRREMLRISKSALEEHKAHTTLLTEVRDDLRDLESPEVVKF